MLAFIRGVSKEMYSTYVYVPEGEELDHVVEGYRRAGLPGCVGSMDCMFFGIKLLRRSPISARRVDAQRLCPLRLSWITVVEFIMCQSHSMKQLMTSVLCRMIRILST